MTNKKGTVLREFIYTGLVGRIKHILVIKPAFDPHNSHMAYLCALYGKEAFGSLSYFGL